MEHLNLHNGFSFDCEEIFEMAVKHFPTNSHFVEIGLGQGKSSGYMAVEIINSGKNIKLDCFLELFPAVIPIHAKKRGIFPSIRANLHPPNIR